jgi:hypothetical protein
MSRKILIEKVSNRRIEYQSRRHVEPFHQPRIQWGTVKASHFEPHGNFPRFLTRSVASLGNYEPNEENRVCKSKFFLQLLFSSFFCMTRYGDKKPF